MARRTLSILKQLPHLGLGPTRTVTYMPRPGDGAPRAVTLIPGDGIGPLVTNAVEQVMQVMQALVYFERYEVHGNMKSVPQVGFTDEFVAEMEPRFQSAFRAMEELEKGVIANPDDCH